MRRRVRTTAPGVGATCIVNSMPWRTRLPISVRPKIRRHRGGRPRPITRWLTLRDRASSIMVRTRSVLPAQRLDLRAELRGERFERRTRFVRDIGSFEVQGDPRCAQRIGQPLGVTHHHLGLFTRHRQAPGHDRLPAKDPGSRAVACSDARPDRRAVPPDATRSRAGRPGCPRGKILPARASPRRRGDAALAQPRSAARLGLSIDELDLVGDFQHPVRQRLGDPDAGNLGDSCSPSIDSTISSTDSYWRRRTWGSC